jgi:hypothetical protein
MYVAELYISAVSAWTLTIDLTDVVLLTLLAAIRFNRLMPP